MTRHHGEYLCDSHAKETSSPLIEISVRTLKNKVVKFQRPRSWKPALREEVQLLPLRKMGRKELRTQLLLPPGRKNRKFEFGIGKPQSAYDR